MLGGIIIVNIIKSNKKNTKKLLINELKRLYICELISIPIFWNIYIQIWILSISIKKEFIHTLIIIYPLSLLSFILLQGSIYWYICLKRIEKKRVYNKIATIYHKLKIINLFLTILYIPIFFAFKISQNYKLIGVFIYFFSILEYINYFFVRLSYKNPFAFIIKLKKSKFPKSSICKEIQKYNV